MSKTKIPLKMRVEVMNRDGLKCLWCGRSAVDGIKLEVDHVISEVFGGKTTYDNLGTLCNECNLGKSSDYFGNYLLATIIHKAPNIFEMIVDRDLGSGLNPENNKYYDGRVHEVSITFFKEENDDFKPFKIKYYYVIPEVYFICTGPNIEIKINEAKDKAIFELKKKIKDYLFQNNGYFEFKDGKIILRGAKQKEISKKQ